VKNNAVVTTKHAETLKGKYDITSKALLMLEVYIDRHIDISPTLLEHWKARNIPKILGLETTLFAHQDLEVMIVEITIVVPSKMTHKKLSEDADIDPQAKGLHRGPMNLDDYSDDDDYTHDDGNTTEIKLNFRLTRAELLIFGHNELIENKKIGMSKAPNTKGTGEESHPEGLLWNILNRLKVSFKVSIDCWL
jgi:hypothetical protein